MAKRGVSKLKRTSEMARVLMHHGFGFLVDRGQWWSYLLAPSTLFRTHKETEKEAAPERLRKALEELGPTYIKLGQAVSTRPDILPSEYIEELAKLQENVPAVSYEEICEVVRQELGCSPCELFATFDHEPIGSASLAQAYKATLHSGERVIVKIQRPNLRSKIEQDLNVLRDLAEFASDHWNAKAIDVKDWFAEFEFTLIQELDFTREGRNADRFRQNFESDPRLYVPRIYWEYTSSRVLTMELIEGAKISDVQALSAAGLDSRDVARDAASIVLKMVYEDGFFHADPHTGNLFVLHDGRIALIDCGMVGRLDEEQRSSLLRIALAFSQSNANQLADEVLGFTYAKGRVNRESIKKDLSKVIISNVEVDAESVSLAKGLNEVLAVASSNGLVVPSSVALLARAFGMAEGIVKCLDPKFNFAEFAEPQLKEIFGRRYSLSALKERAEQDAPFITDFMLKLPQRSERFVSQVERGEFAVITRIDGLDEILRQIHVAANRLAMSTLVAAMTVAVAILTVVYRPSELHRGWQNAVLPILLVVVCGGGLAILISIWRSGHDPKPS